MKKLSPNINYNLLIVFFLSIISFGNSTAQENPSGDRYYQQLNLGIGLGVDYGGVGIKLTGFPDRHIALFIGSGYNLNGLGLNGGASIRFTPLRKACWYYTMMYGYNAVLVFEDAPELNKTYYGISTGMGVELHSIRHPENFWNLELRFPIRSQEYHDDIDDVKANPSMELKSEPLPFSISVGFHFKLG